MATQTSSLSSAASTRQTRLAHQVSKLRTSASAGRLDRWLLIAGGTLAPLGLLAILLGWLGASRTVLTFEQIPYLVSGGLFGLGLVFLGGFIYFAYWQTVIVREGRSQHRDLIDSLGRIERLLSGAAPTGAANGRLVATSTGGMVHRPDCPIVSSRDDIREVTPASDGSVDGLVPCRICDPL